MQGVLGHDTRPPAARPHGRNRTGLLAVVLMAVLLVVGLPAAFVTGRATAPEPPAPVKGMASSAMERFLAQHEANLNSDDVARLAEDYAEDAIFVDLGWGPEAVITGGRKIAEVNIGSRAALGMGYDFGIAIQVGDLVAQTGSWPGGHGLEVYEFNDDGKIQREWSFFTDRP